MAPELNSMSESGEASQTSRLQNPMEQSKLWSSSANGTGILDHLLANLAIRGKQKKRTRIRAHIS
jgi:hypothetical protein